VYSAGLVEFAGAQPKTALRFDENENRWGVPEGNEPTTHILKPATGEFDGFAENEHFCLRLATELGFRAARSKVQYFDDCPVIVVKRYDRVADRNDGRILRVHQEDVCQALSVPPRDKYQSDGGPSAQTIVRLLRDYSSRPGDDIWRFIESLALNWILAGTDAHAKNFSIMIAPGGKVRLAPLYDIASTLPYPKTVLPRKAKLAMSIGGNYKVREISGYHWSKLATQLRLQRTDLLERVERMTSSIPERGAKLEQELTRSGLNHPVIRALTDALEPRCAECSAALQSTDPPGRKRSSPQK
jgi:serine/threonine-protein kinase HipA